MSHVDDCKKFIKYLSEHIDGELDEAMEAEFMRHVEDRERARIILRTFERTIVLHRETRVSALPGDVHKRLRAALEACRELEK